MIKVHAVVDIGCVREKNDDRALVGGTVLGEGARSAEFEDGVLICVADGVGGSGGGGLAAEAALKALGSAPLPAGRREIEALLQSANDAVLALQRSAAALSQAATTVAGVVLRDEGCMVFHAGDSRVYRMRRSRLSCLTVDDSLVLRLAPGGLMPRDAAASPRGGITRWVGRSEGFEAEIAEETGGFYQGDVLLLCSDGLYAELKEPLLEKALAEERDGEALCRGLVDRARALGGRDNITAIVAVKE